MERIIWTIGHSTLDVEQFVNVLESYHIELLVDVRSLPGSNKFPHFNADNLASYLKKNHIDYRYLKLLGGLRPKNKDSLNIAWRNQSFRNYADYMETEGFKEGISWLIEYALHTRTAIMCAEAVWWRCHRSMIADYLTSMG